MNCVMAVLVAIMTTVKCDTDSEMEELQQISFSLGNASKSNTS